MESEDEGSFSSHLSANLDLKGDITILCLYDLETAHFPMEGVATPLGAISYKAIIVYFPHILHEFYSEISETLVFWDVNIHVFFFEIPTTPNPGYQIHCRHVTC